MSHRNSTSSCKSTGSTKSKSSRSSLASTASRFFRFRSSSRSRSSSADTFNVGDMCETVSIVTLRAEETLESEITDELPVGAALEIIEVGEIPRRAKVQAGSISGWISVKTRLNEALITKRPDLSIAADFEVGGQHQVISLVTLRAEENLESDVITELKPGTLLKILEIGSKNKRRGKVETEVATGWISLTTRQGELLIGKLRTCHRQSSSGGFLGTNSSKIKAMLESARCGDLDAIKKIVEGNTGFMGKLSARPNLNCSDIRGKTALIYAAAFGNKHVVDYLLTKRHEVEVNSMDDTQKTALHHASKRARKLRTETQDNAQADIVRVLIGAGSIMDSRDHNGCTPLMFAVANGDEVVARVLLEGDPNQPGSGAQVNVKDYEGHTPLDYARNFGYFHLVKLLKEFNAIDDEIGDVIGIGEEEDPEGEAPASNTTALGSKLRRKSKNRSRASTAAVDANESIESKAKGKAKAKVKAKAKGKAKGKAPPGKRRTMANMVAEMEASKVEAYDKDVSKVEVLDVKEEADDVEIATDKLKAIVASSIVAAEIEGAIIVAKAGGVVQAEIDKAEEKVKVLKGKAKALDRLRQAAECPQCLHILEAAIKEAEKEGCPKYDIEKAKAALQAEVPKQKARQELKHAQDSGDAGKLKAAVKAAEDADLSADDIEAFKNLLTGAENKDKAAAALKEAITTRDVAQLRFSIQQAKDARVKANMISEAVAILKDEEPKAKARDIIAAAIQKTAVDISALKAACQAGKDAKLDPLEYKDCEDMVKREEERVQALVELKVVLESSKEVDMTQIEAIQMAKTKLSDAIVKAKDKGVAEQDLNDYEFRRRKLHNAIEDLKGSIRVFCRVRPLSTKENNQGDTDVTKQIDGMTVAITNKQESKFNFDAVFMPGTQEEVFEDCRDLVQSAADGYNVTLFAYGQTGAGKTYTMGGSPDNPGVSRRTINEIYRVIAANSGRYEYTVLGSMMELYRQDLVDLIAVSKEGRDNVKKLQVRADKAGVVIVEGLSETECKTPDELDNCLEAGIAARKVKATSMNPESSRSHLLFVIKIVSVNRETNQKLYGKILIVDLAGSERLSKSQVEGEGQKEAIEINKSLTALGDVVEALTKGQKQIPYRNHKLTMVMQDALGGSAKTLMFVNCSPAASNAEETTNALKYATRAKKVTNVAKKIT